MREKYRGIRPAPGYPACPDHSQKPELFRLLNAGLTLTESFAMIPISAVSGYYFAHPEAQYFGVARINPDHHFVGTHQDNMRDMRDKRRARGERGLAILKGEGGLPADVRPEELTPMRLFLRGVEITGKVLVRPFVAGVAPPRRRRAARSSR